jgi:hypothetical protein
MYGVSRPLTYVYIYIEFCNVGEYCVLTEEALGVRDTSVV